MNFTRRDKAGNRRYKDDDRIWIDLEIATKKITFGEPVVRNVSPPLKKSAAEDAALELLLGGKRAAIGKWTHYGLPLKMTS